MTTTKLRDQHGNAQAQEGCDRCFCGCKYWENDHCVDCGQRFTLELREDDNDLADAIRWAREHGQEEL